MNLEKKIEKIKIQKDRSLIFALKQMDLNQKKLLLVFSGNDFINLITIGDIQRAIINNISLETEVEKILRKNTIIAHENSPILFIKKEMINFRTECMPIVNNSGKLIDVIFWEEVFEADEKLPKKEILNIPVVIMAGGKGSRLKPLTNVLPKALIPLGEKTMLEEIMDSFNDYGINDFFITVNYKADLIKHFISEQGLGKYDIKYVQEINELGTAGSLYLLKNVIKTTFFVSNCDILIKEEYSKFLEYHKENSNEITIIAVLKHFYIPYGVINTKENGELIDIQEKPELSYKINSGLYILEPHLLNEIPDNTFFHITDLISNIKKRNGRIGVYPVTENSWIDIGDWKEYLNNRYIK